RRRFSSIVWSHAGQRNVAPRPTFGGAGGAPSPVSTLNSRIFVERLISGRSQAFRPGLRESHQVLERGTEMPHTGFGHRMLPQWCKAIAVASPPPCSAGSVTFG